MANDENRAVIGFTSLDLSISMDKATSGNIGFYVKDHPTNVDKHCLLLGLLLKKQLILSFENGVFSVAVKE